MELHRYQWVGLLAGVPLFSGAWLSAYYNTPWWGVAGLLLALVGVYISNLVERERDRQTHIIRGAVAGVLAAIVARALGYIAAMLAGAGDYVGFGAATDLFRAVLAGDWLATVWIVLWGALLGAVLTGVQPVAKQTKKGTKK